MCMRWSRPAAGHRRRWRRPSPASPDNHERGRSASEWAVSGSRRSTRTHSRTTFDRCSIRWPGPLRERRGFADPPRDGGAISWMTRVPSDGPGRRRSNLPRPRARLPSPKRGKAGLRSTTPDPVQMDKTRATGAGGHRDLGRRIRGHSARRAALRAIARAAIPGPGGDPGCRGPTGSTAPSPAGATGRAIRRRSGRRPAGPVG